MISLLPHDLESRLWIFFGLTWVLTNTFWLLQMQNTLSFLPPESRKMKPLQVWLAFIPFFGLAWQFLVSKAVADSLREEFQRRSIVIRESRPGFNAGLTANILLCCVCIPTFGMLIAIFSGILRVVHLLKIKNYSAQLQQVVAVQMSYPSVPLETILFSPANPEEEVLKNNPDRFKPQFAPEEDLSRWRKK